MIQSTTLKLLLPVAAVTAMSEGALTGIICVIAGFAAAVAFVKSDPDDGLRLRIGAGLTSLVLGICAGWVTHEVLKSNFLAYAASGIVSYGAAQIEPHVMLGVINRLRLFGGLSPLPDRNLPKPLDPTPRDRKGRPKAKAAEPRPDPAEDEPQ